MVHLIRRFQQPLMIAITVIVIIAFTWLYSDTRFMDRMGADRVGTIYGRSVSGAEFMRESRKFELCQYLLPEAWQTLIQPAKTQEEATGNFVWNTLVLRKEAADLGIVPSLAEIEEGIKRLPAFRTNDTYDSSKYNLFVANALAPRGLTATALEELVSDSIRLEKAKTLLGTTVAPAASELQQIFAMRGSKFEASVIRWNFQDYLKGQQVSDEDVKTAYEERKSTLKTDEQRKVKYVALTLPNVEKPLVGKERADALSPLSTKAEEFAVAMTGAGAKFEDVAAKLGVPVLETALFTAEQPPADLAQEPAFATAAFKLTKDQPDSDPVQTDKGYFILHLAEVVEAREKTLEEAKVALAETLKTERATEAMNLKATEVRNKIEADLKAGKTFTEAATAAGVKPVAFPPFTLSEPPMQEPDAREIVTAAGDLEPGQISPFQTVGMSVPPTGGLLVFLDKKLPPDNASKAKFEAEKPRVAEQIARTYREATFLQWLQVRRADAGVQMARTRS